MHGRIIDNLVYLIITKTHTSMYIFIEIKISKCTRALLMIQCTRYIQTYKLRTSVYNFIEIKTHECARSAAKNIIIET